MDIWWKTEMDDIYIYICGCFHSHGGTPKLMFFLMENAIFRWMRTGDTPIQETSVYITILMFIPISRLQLLPQESQVLLQRLALRSGLQQNLKAKMELSTRKTCEKTWFDWKETWRNDSWTRKGVEFTQKAWNDMEFDYHNFAWKTVQVCDLPTKIHQDKPGEMKPSMMNVW